MDLSFATRVLVDVYPALLSVGPLEPPMNPQGRYIVRKAKEHTEKDYSAFQKDEQDLIEKHGKRDAEGKLLAPTVNSRGGLSYQLADPVAFTEARNALLDVQVTITGLRAITREELGACPITANAEAALIAAGLLQELEFTA